MATTPHLTVSIEGRMRDRIEVVSLRGFEEVNALYDVELDVTTDAPEDALEEQLLRRVVMLTIQGGGASGAPVARSLYGIVAAAQAFGALVQGRRAYRLRVVPRMWLLKKRRGRRVWSDVSSLDVAAQLFTEHGVAHRTRIDKQLPKRPYRVQYDETDYAFLTRLFAEDGIFFSFDHPREAGGDAAFTSMGKSEVVVLGDTAAAYAPIDGGPDLSFARSADVSALAGREDQIHYFAPRASIRGAGTRLRGYDHRRPTTELRHEASLDPKAPPGTPPAASVPSTLELSTTTVFEGSYEDTVPTPLARSSAPLLPGDAARRLESTRARARVVEGASLCRRLMPGRKISVHDSELPSLDGGYVITRVEHEGFGADVTPPGRALYQCRFTCAPDHVPLRPRVHARRPRASTETAVVVGPAGQEVHTDDLGRVRVRFPWDTSKRPDDAGTAWVRVAHLWAGAGWGAQFVPRVGMEVVVTYLDGDPDRPLVTGCVYNATHPPPFVLPGGASQSGIRTHTTPGGGGANELRFEDKRGDERLVLQAQRDLDVVASRTRTAQIGADDTLRVGGDRVANIHGDDKRTVEGSLQDSVGGSIHTRIQGSEDRLVRGAATATVEGTSSLTVKGDLVEHVAGNRATSVGSTTDGKFVATSYVYGDHVVGASGKVRIKADQGLVFECGDTKVEITKDGVTLKGKSVSLGGEAVTMKGKGPSLKLASDAELLSDKIRIFAKDAWMTLDKDVKMKGALVKMNCDDEQPDAGSDKPEDVKKKPLKMKLSDATFAPYANKKFQLVVDGAVYEGTTTGDGMVQKDVPEDAKSLELTVWIGDYPTGETKKWSLMNVEMPPPTDVKGAQLRLANLGYHAGAATGVLNQDTIGAIASFQADCGLPSTGVLDAATAAKIAAANGS